MTDTSQYRVYFFNRMSNAILRNRNYKDFKKRSELVNWLLEHGTPRVVRITFNNKSGGRGRTAWVDAKTLLGLWQDVDKKRGQDTVERNV